jgi:heat shock protein HslJ
MMKKTLMLAMSLSIIACAPTTGLQQTKANMTEALTAQSSNSTVLSSTVLGNYSWQLVQATSQQGQSINALFVRSDKPVSLEFKNNRIGVLNTCNRMGGSFKLKNNMLMVSNLVSTMMACDAPLNQLDSLMGKLIEGNSTVKINSVEAQPRLTLISASGDTLVFKGIATPESKYGAQAETIFLEIAPHTQTCDAGVRKMQCLQVRQVSFNEQGLKSYPSTNWENFYDSIEGYEHSNNERVIVRVKKYPVKNPPADASSAAYILDMFVEREQVK